MHLPLIVLSALVFVLNQCHAEEECYLQCSEYCKSITGECILINEMLPTSGCSGQNTNCKKDCVESCLLASTCLSTCDNERLQCTSETSMCDNALEVCKVNCKDTFSFAQGNPEAEAQTTVEPITSTMSNELQPITGEILQAEQV